jgi:hypothetical protein
MIVAGDHVLRTKVSEHRKCAPCVLLQVRCIPVGNTVCDRYAYAQQSGQTKEQTDRLLNASSVFHKS